VAAQPLHLPDDDATAALGAKLAGVLHPGDLIILSGGLGAGKTALARAVIRTLMGDPRLDVPSPTFSLVQPYEGHGLRILHADLYRLLAERDADELGLDDSEAIVLVEWPERAPTLAAQATGSVALAIPHSGDGRDAIVSFSDSRAIPA
jgi:tRNA threonylcarbamoyl adenosine modification protein YjeE